MMAAVQEKEQENRGGRSAEVSPRRPANSSWV